MRRSLGLRGQFTAQDLQKLARRDQRHTLVLVQTNKRPIAGNDVGGPAAHGRSQNVVVIRVRGSVFYGLADFNDERIATKCVNLTLTFGIR